MIQIYHVGDVARRFREDGEPMKGILTHEVLQK